MFLITLGEKYCLCSWSFSPFFFLNPLQLDILPLVQLVATDTVDHSFLLRSLSLGIPWWLSAGSDGKESACNPADLVLIPGSGRSPGEGNGYPCLASKTLLLLLFFLTRFSSRAFAGSPSPFWSLYIAVLQGLLLGPLLSPLSILASYMISASLTHRADIKYSIPN